MDNQEVLDEFELKLQQKLQELQNCQEKKDLKSCLKCQEVLECQIRDDYILAVYESMNKGKGGGFEF
jgi:hypothetical protein